MDSYMGQIHGNDADPVIELRARLEAQLASIKQLRREVEQEITRRPPQPEPRRRFHVLPGGMAAAAVGAGVWRARDHSVAIALTAASLAVVLVVPSSVPPSNPPGTPPLAAPPPTERIGPPQHGDEETAPPKKRRRFPIPPEADPAVAVNPVDADPDAADPARRTPKPAAPPNESEPPATRPNPQPEPPPTRKPLRCIAASLPPPDVDVELEQCVETIVGYLAAAA